MKKCIAILLLSVLLLNCAGGWLLFKLMQQANYLTVEYKLKNSENLSAITISLSEYENSRVENNELLLDNKFFDIDAVEFKGDSVTVTGVFDEQEDELVKGFSSFKSQRQNQNHESSLLVLKFLSLIFLTVNNTIILNTYSVIANHTSYCQISFCSTHLFIESPPPKT